MQRKGSSDENFRAENANVPAIHSKKEERNGKRCLRANNIFTLIQSIIEVVISSRYCINKMDDRFNKRNYEIFVILIFGEYWVKVEQIEANERENFINACTGAGVSSTRKQIDV